MRRLWSDLILILLLACLVVGFVSYAKEFTGAFRQKVDIDLSIWHLPQYTFFSMSRGLAAYCLSLVFSLAWGFWAAKDRVAERFLIPILDMLQSIPFLGFLPGVVLVLVATFPRSNIGLELAAILLMFTSQAWNMAFGVYHAVRTVPHEKMECAVAYNFSASQRFRWVELPFAAQSLIWNSIMSMAGGWFFLMINEAFRLGHRDFRLPGLGSYMSVAASEGNIPSMVYAVIAMIVLIVFLDQLLWRPLTVWSQKLRVEQTTTSAQKESWFLNLLKQSHLTDLFSFFRRTFSHLLQNLKSKSARKKTFDFFGKILSRVCLIVLLALIAMAAFYVFRLLKQVPLGLWLAVGRMFLLTFIRVLICLAISLLIMLPLGLKIGLSEKWSHVLQPITQVCASFPTTLLFPILILIFKLADIPLSIGSVILMLMGTMWYVLFNVIAGAKAMPSDLKETAVSFQFSKGQSFKWLHLPAIFPYLITGILAASGGAWNASIVSEYVTYKNQVITTPGIGSTISLAAQNNEYPLLAASLFVMVVVVVLINYQVWLRLYHYSEKRFALNG